MYVLDREDPFVGTCGCMWLHVHVCVGQRMPIGVNVPVYVCMYMYSRNQINVPVP